MLTPPPSCDPDAIVLSFPVPKEQAGLRLDRFICLRIPRLSRTRANEIVRSCAFFADGRKRRASDRVREGETVLLVRPAMREPRAPMHYAVLYEDADVVVVDKPAGLPMHPTATYHRHTLQKLMERDYGDDAPMFCHRLDRETSGIVICSKHTAAEVELKRRFERREVGKRYVAIVRGEMANDRGVIDAPMRGAEDGPHVRMVIAEDGLPAVTEWQVIERRRGASLVSLHPETGRQHQLRVHLASMGHPIVGDKLYGPEGVQPFLDAIDDGLTDELLGRLGHPRHALHAHRLEIPHPRTGALLEIEAPFPPDLVKLWDDPEPPLRGEPTIGWDELWRAPHEE